VPRRQQTRKRNWKYCEKSVADYSFLCEKSIQDSNRDAVMESSRKKKVGVWLQSSLLWQ